MAKDFYVEIGGKSRLLRYRTRQAIELKARFGRPLIRLLREDVMGLVAEPDPKQPGKTVYVVAGTTDPEVQVAFLHAGLVHNNPRLTEPQVIDWIDQHMEAEGATMGDLIEPVWKAVFMSKVLGYQLDMDAEAAKAAADSEASGPSEGGKAPEPAPAIKAAE